MQNKKIINLIIAAVLILCAACDDFTEEDISSETVYLIAPANGIETRNPGLTFYWQPVDEATAYNLMIVQPSFDSIERIIIDSNVSDNKLNLSLQTGKYQWNVVGYNYYSETMYETFSLTVSEDLDISSLIIVQTNPGNNEVLSAASLQLKWDLSGFVDEYNVEVKEGDWESGQTVFTHVTTNSSVDVSGLNNGLFSWVVKGRKQGVETGFNPLSFYIDTIAPDAPQLNTPANNFVSDTVLIDFAWTRASDEGSELSDSIFIYSDATLTNKVIEGATTNSAYTYEVSSEGEYYWFVKTFDKAGYSSDRSEVFMFSYTP